MAEPASMSAATVFAIIAKALANAGGIGAGVSDLFGAKGIQTEDEERELADLRRRQEDDALGLTTAQRRALDLEVAAPVRAGQREDRERQFDILGAQQGGAADVAKALEGQRQQEARGLTQAGATIAKEHAGEVRREEKQLLDLAQQEEDEKRAKQQAWTRMIVSFLGAGADMTEQLAQSKGDQEEQGELDELQTGGGNNEDVMKVLEDRYKEGS